jgi:hypothetical protein
VTGLVIPNTWRSSEIYQAVRKFLRNGCANSAGRGALIR